MRYPGFVSESEHEPKPTPLERAVRTLTSDAALRPVLIVVVLVLGTFLAGGVLLALGNRNLFAIAGVSALVLLTLLGIDNEVRQARRITAGVWAIASVWGAAALIGLTLLWIGAF